MWLEFYFQVLDEDVDVVNTNGNTSPVKTPNSSTGKDLTKRTSDLHNPVISKHSIASDSSSGTISLNLKVICISLALLYIHSMNSDSSTGTTSLNLKVNSISVALLYIHSITSDSSTGMTSLNLEVNSISVALLYIHSITSDSSTGTTSLNLKVNSMSIALLYTGRQKLSTTWFVSIISFLIMNLFQICLLFSLPVHTYLLTCETGYWSIFNLCVYDRVCKMPRVLFNICVCERKLIFFCVEF
jgi:hypothetical protein